MDVQLWWTTFTTLQMWLNSEVTENWLCKLCN